MRIEFIILLAYIGGGILWCVVPPLFYWFMRKVFKVERYRYIKGWKSLKD